MKVSSKKGKGRTLQNLVRDLVLQNFKNLTQNDVRPAIMGQSGMDIRLSQAARKQFPFAVQCKNTQKLNICSAIEQCQANAKDLTPLLVFKRNHSKTYVCLQITDFIKLLKK